MTEERYNEPVTFRLSVAVWDLVERAASIPNVALVPNIILTASGLLGLYPAEPSGF